MHAHTSSLLLNTMSLLGSQNPKSIAKNLLFTPVKVANAIYEQMKTIERQHFINTAKYQKISDEKVTPTTEKEMFFDNVSEICQETGINLFLFINEALKFLQLYTPRNISQENIHIPLLKNFIEKIKFTVVSGDHYSCLRDILYLQKNIIPVLHALKELNCAIKNQLEELHPDLTTITEGAAGGYTRREQKIKTYYENVTNLITSGDHLLFSIEKTSELILDSLPPLPRKDLDSIKEVFEKWITEKKDIHDKEAYYPQITNRDNCPLTKLLYDYYLKLTSNDDFIKSESILLEASRLVDLYSSMKIIRDTMKTELQKSEWNENHLLKLSFLEIYQYINNYVLQLEDIQSTAVEYNLFLDPDTITAQINEIKKLFEYNGNLADDYAQAYQYFSLDRLDFVQTLQQIKAFHEQRQELDTIDLIKKLEKTIINIDQSCSKQETIDNLAELCELITKQEATADAEVEDIDELTTRIIFNREEKAVYNTNAELFLKESIQLQESISELTQTYSQIAHNYNKDIAIYQLNIQQFQPTNDDPTLEIEKQRQFIFESQAHLEAIPQLTKLLHNCSSNFLAAQQMLEIQITSPHKIMHFKWISELKKEIKSRLEKITPPAESIYLARLEKKNALLDRQMQLEIEILKIESDLTINEASRNYHITQHKFTLSDIEQKLEELDSRIQAYNEELNLQLKLEMKLLRNLEIKINTYIESLNFVFAPEEETITYYFENACSIYDKLIAQRAFNVDEHYNLFTKLESPRAQILDKVLKQADPKLLLQVTPKVLQCFFTSCERKEDFNLAKTRMLFLLQEIKSKPEIKNIPYFERYKEIFKTIDIKSDDRLPNELKELLIKFKQVYLFPLNQDESFNEDDLINKLEFATHILEKFNTRADSHNIHNKHLSILSRAVKISRLLPSNRMNLFSHEKKDTIVNHIALFKQIPNDKAICINQASLLKQLSKSEKENNFYKLKEQLIEIIELERLKTALLETTDLAQLKANIQQMRLHDEEKAKTIEMLEIIEPEEQKNYVQSLLNKYLIKENTKEKQRINKIIESIDADRLGDIDLELVSLMKQIK